MAASVKVKWKGKAFDVEVDPAEGLATLQAQLLALTGVPVERQKVLINNKRMKTDDDLKKRFKKGCKVMLMGTADAIPTGPKEEVRFVEDMTNEEKQRLAGSKAVKAGLRNLGNTCYLASTLQCLRHIKPLRAALSHYSSEMSTALRASMQQGTDSMTASLGMLFAELDGSTEPVVPFQFVNAFRRAFPQFDEKSPQGHHMQQDADESLQSIFQTLSRTLRTRDSKPLERLFGGEMEEVVSCDEAKTEKPVTKVVPFTKLACHIDRSTNFLRDGVLASMSESLEKRSPTLERNAVYTLKRGVRKMPEYLVVQFVRFFWRKDTNMKAKIMRKVTFPMKLDVLEFCTDPLRRRLSDRREEKMEREAAFYADGPTKDEDGDTNMGEGARDAARDSGAGGAKDAADKKKQKEKEAEDAKKKKKKTTTTAKDGAEKMELEDDNEEDGEDEEGKKKGGNALAPPVVTDPEYARYLSGLDTYGYYDLDSVVTHQGRSADGGHYIGWARQEGEKWLRFDDDKVTEAVSDDIVKLSGGGDWHMAYICVYRRRSDKDEEAEDAARRLAKGVKK